MLKMLRRKMRQLGDAWGYIKIRRYVRQSRKQRR